MFEVLKYLPKLPAAYTSQIDLSPVLPAVTIAQKLAAKDSGWTDQEKKDWILALKSVALVLPIEFMRLSSETLWGQKALPWDNDLEYQLRVARLAIAALIVDQSPNFKNIHDLAEQSQRDFDRVIDGDLVKRGFSIFKRRPSIFERIWRIEVQKYLQEIVSIPHQMTADLRCDELLKMASNRP